MINKIDTPLVSVIIHSYNRFEYLLNAIESIMHQTYDNFEIIVINDRSDQKEYFTHKFPSKVKLVHIGKNEHPDIPGSRQALINIGSEISNGKYLAFLDDDDIWMPKKLEVQIKNMIEKKYKFSSTEGFYGTGVYDVKKKYNLYNREHFWEILRKKYKRTRYLKIGKFPKIWKYGFIKIHNCIIKSSVIVEKDLFDGIGGIKSLPRNSDYDCWLTLLRTTNLLYIDEPLFYYDGGHGSGQKYL